MEIGEVFIAAYQEAKALNLFEIIGVIAALAYVILAAKRNILCWGFGLLSSVMYLEISVAAAYYQDLFIHFYYIIMSFVGWRMWKKHQDKKEDIIPRFAGWKLNVLVLVAGGILTAASGYVFATYTDNSLPYWDAFTTVFAFMATWMGARRHPEHWLIFVVVDFVGIFMYFVKGFYLSSLLYILYTIIAAIAYFSWVKKMRMAASLK